MTRKRIQRRQDQLKIMGMRHTQCHLGNAQTSESVHCFVQECQILNCTVIFDQVPIAQNAEQRVAQAKQLVAPEKETEQFPVQTPIHAKQQTMMLIPMTLSRISVGISIALYLYAAFGRRKTTKMSKKWGILSKVAIFKQIVLLLLMVILAFIYSLRCSNLFDNTHSPSRPLYETTLNHFELDLSQHQNICNYENQLHMNEHEYKDNINLTDKMITYPNTPPDPKLNASHVKFLALYFPQWYPAIENDMKDDWIYFQNPNFTHNSLYVPLARPKNGIYYDSRCYGLRKTQAALAKKFLVDGFVYYFYYFDGRMLLPEVNERMLVDGEPNTDFAFMWVNEDFGKIKIQYRMDELDGFVDCLAKYFLHPRYIHVQGRPLLYIYLGSLVPDDYINGIILRLASKGFRKPYIVSSIQSYLNQNKALSFADSYAEFPPNVGKLWQSYGYTRYVGSNSGVKESNIPIMRVLLLRSRLRSFPIFQLSFYQ